MLDQRWISLSATNMWRISSISCASSKSKPIQRVAHSPAKDKNLAASEALGIANELVRELAGWALGSSKLGSH